MPLLTLFKTYVGVELHIQLNLSGGKPFTKGITRACRLENSVSDWYSLGVEGVLPIVNKTLLLKTNLLRKVIGSNSTKQPFFFDRKNYTYPDLPKGYQITQNYKGFCTNFKFYFFSDYTKKIERFYIQGVQLEEDVASLNNKSFTYNYNRSGFPLIELITDKLSLKNINTVLDFIGAVKSLFVVLKLSTCRMHRGELRCDLNVSTFLINGGACFNRVEVKNLNSSASIKSSLIFEKYRQFVFLRKNLKMYSKLNLLKNVTKSWSSLNLKTIFLRFKEGPQAYNFYEDPDVPILYIKKEPEPTLLKLNFKSSFTKNKLKLRFFFKNKSFIKDDYVPDLVNLYYLNPFKKNCTPRVCFFYKSLRTKQCVCLLYKLLSIYSRLEDSSIFFFRKKLLEGFLTNDFSTKQIQNVFKFKSYRYFTKVLVRRRVIKKLLYFFKKNPFSLKKYKRGFLKVLDVTIGFLLKNFNFRGLGTLEIRFQLKLIADKACFYV